MTDNQKTLSRREMSAAEGVRKEGGPIRDRAPDSSADLTVGTPPVCGEPGYHRIHGEETKPVPEASLNANQSRCETARDLASDADRLTEPVCACRDTDAAAEPSLRPVVSAPGGKAGRLKDPRVSDRNAGTHVSPPVLTTSANSAESSDGGARGRSSRSSPRPGKPATWRRGADVESGLRKEEPPVDSGEQADKAWLLDIQRKLYTWSRNHPGEAWQDMWGWLTSPRNLRVAWRRVASNRGARSAGVDRLTVKQVEQRIGVERFLGDLGERLRRRVGDLKVTRLVLAFLKAGVLAEEGFLRSDAGTPQGGILSPLVANVVLSAIEARYERYIVPGRTRDGKAYVRPGDQVRKFRHRERKAGRPVFLPVRYADDFVVLVAGSEQQAREEKEALAAYLGAELKLTLSAEKTHVTALTEGFDFLGHRIRLRWDDRWGYWPRVEIPKKKVRDLCYRIKQLTNRGHTCRSFQAVIDGLNPVLRGWGNFYRHCLVALPVVTGPVTTALIDKFDPHTCAPAASYGSWTRYRQLWTWPDAGHRSIPWPDRSEWKVDRELPPAKNQVPVRA
jgi:retron-type reverse transcriptase